ncbi:hypothetical protein GCM10010399_21980 [Dactylosporangium fulvum]|uniref:Hsp70 family protein n=1 Tax=Dactylosporangium fulvum TaxID=53359 RepID=A0ABY5W6G7_9ACTN|nr:Hsp70 family protein [Dactylosporangium fulvum]UWP85593.1 Hsp70 family protein [Dactylosporangium fulvum]
MWIIRALAGPAADGQAAVPTGRFVAIVVVVLIAVGSTALILRERGRANPFAPPGREPAANDPVARTEPVPEPTPEPLADPVAEPGAQPEAGRPTAAPRLAVDYGTSNTVALMRRDDDRIRPLLFDASPLLPSAVHDVGGQILTGRDAVNAARLDPGRHEPNPKRRLNENSILLGDREHDLADLVAATLRRVADEVRHAFGVEPGPGTALTHPAAWGAIRRSILTDAAARAGLTDPVLVPEPVAAATYYATVLGQTLPHGHSLVVYDLGAGTFDTSVVRRDGDGLDVLAADGLDDLGGLDFDALVVDLVGAQVRARTGEADERWQHLLRPRDAAERRLARLLWDDARAAKEALSRLPMTAVSLPGLGVETHVTREQFEAAARPLVDRTVRATAAVLRAAAVPPDRVAGLFLVGGATRMPLAATMLFQQLRIRPTVLEQPEIVVAEGALHHIP